MSKSRGNVIDPVGVIETFGADALRFYCAREVSFGQDGPVSEATFATRYESELANDFGNLASRTLSMVTRYREGRIPAVELDQGLAGDFEGLTGIVRDHLDRFERTSSIARWPRWPRGCASSACCCTRTCPRARPSCWRRWARRTRRWRPPSS